MPISPDSGAARRASRCAAFGVPKATQREVKKWRFRDSGGVTSSEGMGVTEESGAARRAHRSTHAAANPFGGATISPAHLETLASSR